MEDFAVELGKSLTQVLSDFKNKPICADYLIGIRQIEGDTAKECIFALYRRNYVRNVESKEFDSPSEISLADFFQITVEGINYLELYRKWWRRFWFRSIICPLVVSFLTAVNVNNAICFFSRLLP